MRFFCQWFACFTISFVALSPALGQNKTASGASSQSAPNTQNTGTQNTDEPDQPVPATSDKLKDDPAGALATAWEILQSASQASKPAEHVSLLVAVGTLGGYKQARDILTTAMKDKDVDIRLAAVAAAGSTEDRALIPALRIAMEDQAPEVVVTAAASLWKMDDYTGINVLQQVLTGQMKSRSGVLKTEMHKMNKDLHDPSAMAMIGAEQGASVLLGPFGIAMTAAKMAYQGPSPNSARVVAATLLSNDPNDESNKTVLLQTMHDKDHYVRQASARALAKFHGKDVTDALLGGFDDPKPSVRYMAAASYIRVVSPLSTEKPPANARRPAKKKPATAQQR